MSYLSLSTWSLHRNLGPLNWTIWDVEQKKHTIQVEYQPETMTLLELPAILSSKGFKAIEICHFNFPSTDSDYLEKLKLACEEANITFNTLLLDYGDITADDEVRRHADISLIKNWIDIASECGAKQIRIIAGDASPENEAALALSSEALNDLIKYANNLGVRIITENFHSLTSTADNCIQLVKNCNEELGLIADFGNFKGENKYEEIEKIISYSQSVHAKPDMDSDGIPDEEEFRKCLDQLVANNYNGPINLIYDGPGDMWEGIERVRKIVDSYL
ncbi:sugar phosphate isomerase/epimerase family protein [Lederbergia panacisoli]|uniref:sugar phosphate isomerase/epimerase family protein n=1 Tax=Lederbergia panacisoli TaxID=1255251 RepID=UPI00214C57FB|nr:sugar phosphate isomerase/epimerase [Lederbergia panacisoli]MCR2823872.1 sugar phosphate isomerase/epimerase [Lederbergia panacisoli]